jgi:hypothetical protein
LAIHYQRSWALRKDHGHDARDLNLPSRWECRVG